MGTLAINELNKLGLFFLLALGVLFSKLKVQPSS